MGAPFKRPFNRLNAALMLGLPLAGIFSAGMGTKGFDLYKKKMKAEDEIEKLKQQTLPLLLATTLGSGALVYNAVKEARRAQNKYSSLQINARALLKKQATAREIWEMLMKRSPEAVRKYAPYIAGGALLSPLAYFMGRGTMGQVYSNEEEMADKYLPVLNAINTLGPLAGAVGGGMAGYGMGLTSNDVRRDYRRRGGLPYGY